MNNFFDAKLIWTYLVKLIWALPVNIELFVIITVIAFIFGVASAFCRLFNVKGASQFFGLIIHYTRGTPIVIQLFIIYYGLPIVLNKLFGVDAGGINPLVFAVVTYVLNTSTVFSDAVRTSIISVGKGQLEAGYMSELTAAQIYKRIIFPQAFRVMFPTISINACTLIKDMSLVYLVGVKDVMGVAITTGRRSYHQLEAFIAALIIFAAVNLLLEVANKLTEKRFSRFLGVTP